MNPDPPCPLCRDDGGDPVWRDDLCRVVIAPEPDYPGFCRVILNRHVCEMTDVPAPERGRLMQVVFSVEHVLREVLRPDKINLASLGNVVPHVHWHVIPRFRNDARFPDPVWGPSRRPSFAVRPDWREALRSALVVRL
jgi:diadenosine tetraphosphate (Ap4A) HIT family hydrolase